MANPQSILPLSTPQIVVYHDQMLHPDVPKYNQGIEFLFKAALNPKTAQDAFNRMAQASPSMRSVIVEVEGEVFQKIQPENANVFAFNDCRSNNTTASQRREKAYELLQKALHGNFELSTSGFRCDLFQIDDAEFLLFISFHHLFGDGMTGALIIEQFLKYYEAAQKNQNTSVSEDVSYQEFVAEDAKYLTSKRYQASEAYWKAKFAELPEVLFPKIVECATPKENHVVTFPVQRQEFEALTQLAESHGHSMAHLLIAFFATYFARMNNKQEVVIGVPVHNRSKAKYKTTLGMFSSILPVRVAIDAKQTLAQTMAQVANELQESYRHQRFPLADLNRVCRLAAEGRTQLFDITVSVEQFFVDYESNIGEFHIARNVNRFQQTPVTITVMDYHAKDDVFIELCCHSGIFDRATVDDAVLRVQHLLKQYLHGLTQNPALTSAQEQQQLVHELNQTSHPLPTQKFAHQLFEDFAATQPDKIAVLHQQSSITYNELNQRANALAHQLISRGVKPNSLVAIAMSRSIDMVVGIFAVLKAGGAYLPIDMSYPADRVAHMLSDAQPLLLLSNEPLSNAFENAVPSQCEVLNIAVARQQAQLTPPQDYNANPDLYDSALTDRTLTDSALAYVIYTSGSTGKPKGAMIEHRNLMNLIVGLQQAFSITSNDRLSQCAAVGFDMTVMDIFTALCSGGSLVLRDEDWLNDTQTFWRHCEHYNVTFSVLPTAFWHMLASDEASSDIPTCVRGVVSAGEAINPQLAKQWLARAAHTPELFNGYGPTEVTAITTIQAIHSEADIHSIGYPIANLSAYVLDQALNIVPLGTEGELYIGGGNVGRGYLNRPELTQSSFLENPFHQGRMYKTGDLVKRLPSGQIEYVARIDKQVKLRGFRIELGEIESQLAAIDNIQDSVVTVQESPKRLIAYLVPLQPLTDNDSAQKAFIQTVKSALRETLPDYMLPSVFMLIDELPLTPNGKVDRKALPEPDTSGLQEDYVAPRSDTEAKLATFWQDILHVESVGIYDNFFALGGHSLSATRLLGAIRDTFRIDAKVNSVFTHQTIAAYAAFIGEQQALNTADVANEYGPKITPVNREHSLVLSFAQQRLWLADQIEPESTQYLMPGVFALEGELNTSALQNALQTIVERHEILRSVYREDTNKQPVQVILNDVTLPVTQVDVSGLAATEQQNRIEQLAIQEAQTPFDLANDLMLRVTLIKRTETSHVLLLTKHHIASDGWSVGVLTAELAAIYTALTNQKPHLLAALPIQYADYAAWQRNTLQGETLKQQVDYWRKHLLGIPSVHSLPLDKPRPEVQSFVGESVISTLSAAQQAGLHTLASKHSATLFMVLQSAFATLIHRYSGEADIVLGTSIANREQNEVNALIGFFVNTLLLRSDFSASPNFDTLIAQSKTDLLAAYQHQQVPFEKLVDELQPERNLSHNPLFQIMFTLQNTDAGEFALPGVAVQQLTGNRKVARVDLSVDAQEQGNEGIALTWEFATDLFERQTIERMAEHFSRLVDSLIAKPELPVAQLNMISTEEAAHILQAFNSPRVDYVGEASIHARFEARVAQMPDAIAVVHDQLHEVDGKLVCMSYAELNEQANRVAHYLLANGVQVGDLVGIFASRSPQFLVAILGIMKAGAAYVPLDPINPQDRINTMIATAQVKVLFSEASLQSRLVQPAEQQSRTGQQSRYGQQNTTEQQNTKKSSALLWIDLHQLPKTLASYPTHNPNVAVSGDDLAYMIFTSGSTGTPKGALVHHAGALNHIDAEFDVLGFMPSDKSGLLPKNFLQSAASSSDVSVWQFLAPVVSGGKSVILLDMADVENIFRQLQKHDVHLMQAAPVVLQLIVEHAQRLTEAERQLPALQWMMAIAEALPIPVLNGWLALYPNVPVMNGYGPSEASDDITEYVLASPLSEDTASVPIGRPLPNLTMYVLNDKQQLQPLGVPGELCVSGVGVGPGYLNNSEKTEQAFIPNPFAGKHGVHGERLYRTGDLGRWVLDDEKRGVLEFMGRIDNQVKVRGFRIELGEVEAAIAQVAGVADVAVLAVKNHQGQNALAAYITRNTLIQQKAEQQAEQEVNNDDIRAELSAKLPDYMMPASFTWLDKMPLNAADKIDRRRLPKPDFSSALAESYVPPRNAREAALVEIWQELLGIEKIGIHDNFFEVGGHSLSATRLASAIRATFDVEAMVRVVFEHQTIAALSTFISNAVASNIPALQAVNHQIPQPLSFAQQRLWLIHEMDPQSAQYVIPFNLRFEGALDIAALTKSLNAIVQRHKVLRTVYRTNALDEVQQIVCDATLSHIPMVDLSNLDRDTQQQEAQKLAEKEAAQGFDLAEDLMLRATFVKLAEDDHVLMLTIHHIAFDGWSGGVLAQEVSALYQAFKKSTQNEQENPEKENREKNSPLAPLAFNYVDFAVWQRNWLQGEALSQQLDFWKHYLAAAPTVHNLPLDYPRPSLQNYASGEFQHYLPHVLGEQLQAFCKTHDVTLFMLLNAAFTTLLHRYSGDTDILVGSPIANREHAELEDLVGFFVNTLVLRSNFEENPRFIDVLQQGKQDLLNAYQHQQIPFEKLVEELGVARSLSHNPLVQVLIVLQNTQAQDIVLTDDNGDAVRISEAPFKAHGDSAGFDLSLDVRDSNGQLSLTWSFATDLFAASTIERMASHYERLLQAVLAAPDLPVSQLSMITQQEAAHILHDFNAPLVNYEGEPTIHQRFEARAAETPQAIAVVHDRSHEKHGQLVSLSYAELNTQANQIAHFLRDKGVKVGDLVGIFASRSPQFLVAILGIMKAGAAYVPLDPINPQDRIDFMIANAELTVLFSEEALKPRLADEVSFTWVDLHQLQETLADYPTHNPSVKVGGDDLAYMIYTSGSTGMPKGAQIHHAGALNHIDAEFDILGFMPDDKSRLLPTNFLQSAASSSDVSVWQFLAPVISGGTTVILLDMADVENIIRQVQMHQVHLMQAVPVLIQLMLEHMRVLHNEASELPSLRWVMSTGDALPVPVVNAWLARFPNIPIMNGYGPSEASDDITEYVLDTPLPSDLMSVPIGRPIPNLTMYVLNEQQQLQPIGVPGELCVSGIGVGKGYKNNPEKTQAVFIDNPFFGEHPEYGNNGVHGQHMYRTGDLGRWLADGTIEFMGRIDNQVKVRGFRIELGEVEAAIAQVEGVADVAVITVQNHQQQTALAAYLTRKLDSSLNSSVAVDTDDVRAVLKAKLPDYMMPSTFMWLDKMPLNAADKIDRRRLPKPDFSAEIADSFVAPQSEYELALADIWQSILGIDKVGVHDNFFEIGGHSLTATRLASAMRALFDVDVMVRAVFEHQTIAELAQFVASADRSGLPPLLAVDHSVPQPLSFAQQRLWLLQQMEPDSAQHHVPSNLHLRGPLDTALFTRILDTIIQRHKVLRTVYRTGYLPNNAPRSADEPFEPNTQENYQHNTQPSAMQDVMQIVREVTFGDIPLTDISHLSGSEQQHAAQRLIEQSLTEAFDLDKDLMLRARFVKLADDEHLLLLCVHHIAFDGWSGSVLIQEVSALYQQFVSGDFDIKLAPLNRQYIDFAVWQRNWLQGDALEAQLSFWKDYLDGVPTVHSLPLDRQRSDVQDFTGARYYHKIDKALTQKIHALCKAEDVTFFMLLNAAFSTLLHRYSSEQDIVIGSPIANRELAALEPLVGFFVNTLVLRTQFTAETTFKSLLAQSKQDLLNAYQHQQIPFEKLVEALDVPRNLSHNPLVQVMLILQNTTSAAFAPNDSLESELQVSAATLGDEQHKTGFDLTLEVNETDGELNLSWSYATALFNRGSIECMAMHFERLLQQLLEHTEQPVAQLAMLTDAEASELLTRHNSAQVDYQGPNTLHGRFEQQAAKTPESTAVILDLLHEENGFIESMTYAELNACANRVAHFLNAQGIGKGSFVGIFASRSPRFLAAMLGIMKAGAAYVPIDPVNPAERIQYMIENAELTVLFSEAPLQARIPATDSFAWFDLEDFDHTFASFSTDNPTVEVTGDDLAYMVYTSGSTGQPKGALVHHAGAMNHIDAEFDVLGFMSANKSELMAHNFLQSAASSSDVSIWQFLSPVVSGGHTVILRDMTDAENIVRQIQRHKVNLVQFVPVVLQLLIEYVQNTPAHSRELPSLKWLMQTGDALPVAIVNTWLAHYPTIPVMNGYGPSEASDVIAEHAIYEPLPANTLSVPIGRPLPNLTLYVMNAQQQLQPIGVPGEICVSGIGVGKGYKNNPEKTDEVFKANPFSNQNGMHGDRLYRTGDLGRWVLDDDKGSVLEFMGRIDNQVKVRGFRIELGEIEATLSKIAGVGDVAVIAVKNHANENTLAAYVTRDNSHVQGQQHSVNTDILRETISEKLPNYMMPAAFMWLEKMPLNPAGKIDRRRLPKPELMTDVATRYVAPRNGIEEALASIWQELLDLEKVGIHDNFFAIGGHSLNATRLASAMRLRFEIDVAVRVIFEHQTIAELAEFIPVAAHSLAPPLLVCDHAQPQPLSFAQQRLWLIHQMDEQGMQYLIPSRLRFEGALNKNALTLALNEILQRHSVLRTVYRADESGEVQQIVCDAQISHVPEVDLSHLNDDAQQQEIQQLIEKETSTAFDLANDVLLRCLFIKLADQDHLLFLTLHHIAYDGWSGSILTRELSLLYQQFASGQKQAQLPELTRQYIDFAVWQRQWLQGEVLEQQLDYWKTHLQGVPTVHNLPLDYARPNTQSFAGAHHAHWLSEALTLQLNRLCQQQGVTLFMLLNAAFATLLHRHSGDTDIVIGSPIANREQAELEPLVGFFVNTLVLRTEFIDNPRFSELLQQSKQNLLNAYQHQQIPFEKLVESLDVPRNLNHNPLIQVLLVLQNNEALTVDLNNPSLPAETVTDNAFAGNEITGGELTEPLTVSQVPFDSNAVSTGFDLTLDVQEADGKMLLSWGYATELFKTSTINAFSEHFEQLLLSIVEDVNQTCAGLNMVTARERQDLIYTWNDTQQTLNDTACIHEFFEEYAQSKPNAQALTIGEQSFTYAQINTRANQLAHFLIEQGVVASLVSQFGDMPIENDPALVGIYVDRSVEMIVAMVAIWKSGGTYVPIDPNYPKERVQHILDDSGVRLVVTTSDLYDQLPQSNTRRAFSIDDTRQFEQYSGENIAVESLGITSESLAYIIYTSGSTGKPKGSLLHHKGLVNLALAQRQHFGINAESRVLQLAAVAFDATTCEIVSTLVQGASLHLLTPREGGDPRSISAVVKRQQVTHAIVAPVLLPYLHKPDWESCTHLLVAAEVCPQPLVEEWSQGRHFVNGYGPSEASVCSTMMSYSPDYETLPIGLPIANTQAYVLNEAQQVVPVGVVGELYLGGIHLSYGYLNRQELNQQVFIANPFSNQENSRLYRTGDLVRRLPCGNLVFVGRADQQVKIRGIRIELSEIKAAMLQLDWIKEAVVVARDEPKRLVAYVVEEAAMQESEKADLIEVTRTALQAKLPEYMVPTAYVMLSEIPLTRNRKIDYKALPVPEPISTPQQDFVAPQSDVHAKLCELWEKVLGVSKVSINDNFFTLGGHSLLATQLVILVRQAFDTTINVRDVFEHQTIREFAAEFAHKLGLETHAENQPLVSTCPINSIAVQVDRDAQPLSFSQKRLWLLEQMQPGSVQYNMPGMVRVAGDLNVDALQTAFNQILQRHEVLRTTYAMNENGEPIQVISDSAVMPFTVHDLRSNTVETAKTTIQCLAEQQLQTPFDLSKDVMMRAEVVLEPCTDSERFIVLFTMHHIASDGWSFSVLVNELNHFYQTALGKPAEPLPELPVQYLDYAAWQQQQTQQDAMQQSLTFWQHTLAGIPAVHSLPLDFERPETPSYAGCVVHQQINTQITSQLKALATQHNVSMFMLMHSAFSALFHRYTEENDIVIATAIANREQPEIEHLIGFFVNTLVLRANFEQQPSFDALIQQSREHIFAAFNHQQVPFDMVVDALQPERDQRYNPLFQIILTLHNQASTQLAFTQQLPSDNTHSATGIYVDEGIDVAKFDLTLDVTELASGKLGITWTFATDLFKPATIVSMAEHFERLLDACLQQPQQPIAQLNMLSAEETQQLLQPTQPLVERLPSYQHRADNCLHQRFEQQAALNPARTALVYAQQRLSYAEVNAKANQLARYLRKKQQITPDTLVGLCVSRSAEMVVSILAILKAGAAYVPLDPSYPKDRIDYIVQDAQLNLVLAESSATANNGVLADFAGNVIAVDSLTNHSSTHACDIESVENINVETSQVTAANLAYVIYTSGSTGKPKGVLQTHHNALRLFDVTQPTFEFSEKDVWCLFHSFAFDFSVWELWGALLYSGKLLIPSFAQTRDTALFIQLCQREELSILNQTPSAFENLTELLVTTQQALQSVRVVIFGGEALAKHHVQLWQSTFTEQRTQLVNMYGITETTVHVTHYTITGEESGAMPIGKPLADQYIVLLNEALSLVPKGCVGEMYVGGEGLAPGYLQRDDLTAERFIPNPFSDPSNSSTGMGKRLYKTGDLAKYNEAGELVFMGRCDDQVKIRGFRIELGEIEAKLNQCHFIDSSVALNVPSTTGDNQLVAYIRASEFAADQSDWVQQAKTDLANFIPTYMFPSLFVPVDIWPLTVNGKIDKKALPTIELAQQKTAYVAPNSATERKLHDIWCDILKQEQISIHANFYEVGGNSLLLVRLNVKIKQELSVDIPLMQLAKLQTIAQLANAIIDGVEEQGALVAVSPQQAKENRSPQKVLLCVPYAGADGLVFQKLAESLGDDFAVYALQFPRDYQADSTDNTALYAYFEQHLASAVASVKALVHNEAKQDIDFYLWGHCAGSLPATWFAQLLQKEGITISEFFVGGSLWEPVQASNDDIQQALAVDFQQQLSPLEDVANLLSFAGFDANDTLTEEEWQVILPKAQKDQLFSSWCLTQFALEDQSLLHNSTVHCVIAKDDPITEGYQSKWQQWQQVSQKCHLYELSEGGHYFIDNQFEKVAEWVREVSQKKELLEVDEG